MGPRPERGHELYDFDLDKAKRILEDAGYKDTDGDGVREMPNGGEPLKFTYYARSDGETGPKVAEFVRGWLDEIGIATTEKIASDSELTPIIGKGDYDMFAWGWTPYVDPDTMLDYMTCKQVAADPDDPTNYYNDANYCDPEYDKLYAKQKVELDPEKRMDIVHEMLTRWAALGLLQRPVGGAGDDRLPQGPVRRAGPSSRPRRGRCSSRTPRRRTRS